VHFPSLRRIGYSCAVTDAIPQYAILFADISDSTALYEKLGDQRALAAVETVLTEMRKAIAFQNGRVVKTIGDEIMAVFASADAAMQAACDMQIRVSILPAIDSGQLAIRAGFHLGPAIEDKNDFFGDAVNTAARMTGFAKGGQIITSGTSVESLSPLLRKSTRDLDVMPVKGKQEEIRIYEVLWQESEDLTTLSKRDAPNVAHAATLTLRYRESTLTLNATEPTATLGRDNSNGLVVSDKMASRVHCKIEYRRANFFLIDQSTNGTYVTVGSDVEMRLNREQFMLRGSGVICLGHNLKDAGSEIVAFTCSQAIGPGV
jgi:adenylate cyclase